MYRSQTTLQHYTLYFTHEILSHCQLPIVTMRTAIFKLKVFWSVWQDAWSQSCIQTYKTMRVSFLQSRIAREQKETVTVWMLYLLTTDTIGKIQWTYSVSCSCMLHIPSQSVTVHRTSGVSNTTDAHHACTHMHMLTLNPCVPRVTRDRV